MSHDPQNAPDFYQSAERIMVDDRDVRVVLLIDQDGDETVMDEEEWRYGPDRF